MTPDRRVAIITVALWTLVAAGPVLGLLALTRPLPAAVAEGAPRPAPGTTGMAELAVVAHLTHTPGQVPATFSPAHPALRPLDDPLEGLPTTARATAVAAVRGLDHVATVAATPAGPDRWGVTVVVLRDGMPEGWQVTVAETPTGPQVETVPAVVALPARSAPATPALTLLRPPEADDALASAVSAFLTALLTGEGQLDRYLAPGVAMATPATRFAEVELLRIARGPVDPTRAAVMAEARVTRVDGAVHLIQQPLLLQHDDGRWEVQRILPALPLQPPPDTTALHDDEGNQP